MFKKLTRATVRGLHIAGYGVAVTMHNQPGGFVTAYSLLLTAAVLECLLLLGHRSNPSPGGDDEFHGP
jgi:hypothetical protein